MRNGPGRRARLWAGIGSAACGVAVLAAAFWVGGLGPAAEVATVIAIVPLGIAALRFAWSASKRSAAVGDRLQEGRRELAASVRTQWFEEAKARQLLVPDPLRLTWRLSKLPVGDFPAGGTTETPDLGWSTVGELAQWFGGLTPRRLVIIGAPGTGKTSLAVLLLLKLHETLADDGAPVPVMFSLSSFDPARDTLKSWLGRRLNQEHPQLAAQPYEPGLPAKLVRERQILPVLDGLDEITQDARPLVMKALTTAMDDPELGLILTSRADEYSDAVRAMTALRSAPVIEPDPLSPEQAADYLDRCLTHPKAAAWQPVLDAMRLSGATPVAEALVTPLMLWLVRKVYMDIGKDPIELTDVSVFPNSAAIEAHLIRALIPALLEASPPDSDQPGRRRRSWDVGRTQRWLGYLARFLKQQGTADLAWWELREVVAPGAFGLGIGVAVAITGGLAAALPAGPTVGPLLPGLVVGTGAGITAGLTVGLAYTRWRMTPHAGDRRVQRLMSRVASVPCTIGISALGCGLTVGTAFGLSSGISQSPFAGIKAGALPALGAAVATGLGVGFGAARKSPPVPSRPVGFRFSIPGLAAVLAGGLGAGLAVGLPYGFGFGSVSAFAGALSIGLAVMIEGKSQETATLSPQTLLRYDRTVAGIVVLASGLGIGVVFGIGFSPWIALAVGFSTGLGFAVVVAALRVPWLSYTLTRSWLAFRGDLPWRLAGFLQDTHKLGILRQVGTIYQFRHEQLQRYLADFASRAPGE
jgi:hypothetical protein